MNDSVARAFAEKLSKEANVKILRKYRIERFLISSLLAISLLSFVGWAGLRIVRDSQYMSAVSSAFLVNHTTSFDSAKVYAKEAFTGFEKFTNFEAAKNLNRSYTSIFINSEDENVERYLLMAKAATEKLPTDEQVKNQFEARATWDNYYRAFFRNIDGESIYPYNKEYFWWCMISLMMIVVSLTLFVKSDDWFARDLTRVYDFLKPDGTVVDEDGNVRMYTAKVEEKE